MRETKGGMREGGSEGEGGRGRGESNRQPAMRATKKTGRMLTW